VTERLIVFVDDARLMPHVSGQPDVVVVSLDTQAAHELDGRPGLRVKSISEYAPRPFASYDDLYGYFKDEMRERFAPKDPARQSRFLFEVLWDDILLNLIQVHYIERLVEAVRTREQPTRFEFGIANRELDALFRRIVGRLP
jgi:hypothetical protein